MTDSWLSLSGKSDVPYLSYKCWETTQSAAVCSHLTTTFLTQTRACQSLQTVQDTNKSCLKHTLCLHSYSMRGEVITFRCVNVATGHSSLLSGWAAALFDLQWPPMAMSCFFGGLGGLYYTYRRCGRCTWPHMDEASHVITHIKANSCAPRPALTLLQKPHGERVLSLSLCLFLRQFNK